MPDIDYAELDRQLDEEFFGRDSTENADDSPNEIGTESEEETTVTEPEGGTPETVDTDAEQTVPESRYKEAVRAMNEAQRELAEMRKQYTDTDRTVAELKKQIEELQSSKEEKPDTSELSLDEIDDYQAEIAKPLLKIIDDLKTQLAEIKGEVGNVKTVADRYQQNEAVTAQERWRQSVKERHEDIEELEKSEDFWKWANTQPPVIQYALQQGTPADAIAALDLYRMQHPKEQVQKEQVQVDTEDKLAKAKAISTPNVKSGVKPNKKQTFTMAQIEKMSRDEFLKNEAAIDEALLKGEVY